MKPTVLVVEDYHNASLLMTGRLREWGYKTIQAATVQEARQKLAADRPAAVVVVAGLPDGSGVELLGEISQTVPDSFAILVAGDSRIEYKRIAWATRAHFMAEPIDFDELKARLSYVIASGGHRSYDFTRLPDHIGSAQSAFAGIVGNSPPMRTALDLAYTAAQSMTTTVLLLGETGTGKGIVAKAIHFNSKLARGPFIAINCAEPNPNLIESELFGHEKGAFTGASAQRKGCFERADGGTLFLDEIGEFQPELQAKLLRALEEQVITRVGGSAKVKVNVRILAATNRDLEAAIAEGEFRRDLYHRLRVAEIRLPPLRERGTDILLLAEHFRRFWNERQEKWVEGLTPEVSDFLLSYDWPGNVRELSNTMEWAVARETGRLITLDSLSEFIRKKRGPVRPAAAPSNNRSSDDVDIVHRRFSLDWPPAATIVAMLDRCGGNKALAAKELGISRDQLYRRLGHIRNAEEKNSGSAQ